MSGKDALSSPYVTFRLAAGPRNEYGSEFQTVREMILGLRTYSPKNVKRIGVNKRAEAFLVEAKYVSVIGRKFYRKILDCHSCQHN